MKIDAPLAAYDPAAITRVAREREEAGYHGLFTAETQHDPFLPLAMAAGVTERIELQTSIAVAFARNPMLLANIGHDLQLYSQGRFSLGLGSQIRPHIENRFSMPWSRPAARMRELVVAMRTIWRSWETGERLDFRGEFYRHTLMTPNFNPGPNGYGPPKILLAAVGPVMTEVAGEVADGLLVHAFTTARYLRERTLPAFEKGLATSGRTRAEMQISCPVFLVTGATEEAMAKSRRSICQQIAFYGSTPDYRAVLELHGWGELQTELNALSKSERPNKWGEMGQLIEDDVLAAFAVVGEPSTLAERLAARFGQDVDRISLLDLSVGPMLLDLVA
ncbi:MAG: LLM class F420-dependent oxidoreductase [Acidimicrobiales bacterium]